MNSGSESILLTFSDHFSDHADYYEAYRPTYPEALFAYLVSLTLGHALAWDCATGNGQAAVALTAHFDAVVATDASPHPEIEPSQEREVAWDLRLPVGRVSGRLATYGTALVVDGQSLRRLGAETPKRQRLRMVRLMSSP
jgi:hypothetical protein